jgi:hypothetical protein
MKAMVLYFMTDTHKVRAELILAVFVFGLVGTDITCLLSLPFLRSFCNNILNYLIDH